MIQQIEQLIKDIEGDIMWHEKDIDKCKDIKLRAARIGASTALKQVVNDLKIIIQ